MSGTRPGRSRSEKSRTAILTATRDLVAEVGYEHVTIEGIASRAHVGKQTIYRWWSSKSAILADCVLDGFILLPRELLPQNDDIRIALTEWLRNALVAIGDPNNASLIRGLNSAAADDPDLALVLYQRMTEPYESSIASRLDEAAKRGELRSDISAADVIEMLFGTILYRLLSRLDVGPQVADNIIEILFSGLRPT